MRSVDTTSCIGSTCVAVVAVVLLCASFAPITSAKSTGEHVTVLRGNQASTTLPTWRNLYDWTAGHGYVGIGSATSVADSSGYSFARGLPEAAGLWVWPTGARRYEPGFARFSYAAPGTTRILSAEVSLTYKPRLLSHHCVRVFLIAGASERDGKTFCKPPGPPAGTGSVQIALGDPASNPTAKALALQIELPCDKSNSRACSTHIPAADPPKDAVQFSKLDLTLVDDDQPVPAPAGEWYDLEGDYVNGKQQHGLTLAASDAGSGVRRVAVEEVGRGELDARQAPCDETHKTVALNNRICPASFSVPTTIDATQLAEGEHVFRETARDVANNFGASEPWAVFVDRTPPAQVANFAAAFGPATNETVVSWDPAVDPPLADGSPGSGVASYRYRYQRGSGPWSAWQSTPNPWFTLVNSHAGERVHVEVQAVDAVGNEGPLAIGSATAVAGSFDDGFGQVIDEHPQERFIRPPDADGDTATAAGGRCKEITNARYKTRVPIPPHTSPPYSWRIRLTTRWCYARGRVIKLYPAEAECKAGTIEYTCANDGWKMRANCYGGAPERCAWTYRYNIYKRTLSGGTPNYWCATNQVRGDGRHFRHGSCKLGPWAGPMYG